MKIMKNKELTFEDIENKKRNKEMWAELRVELDMEILRTQKGKTIYVDFTNKKVLGAAPHDIEDHVVVNTAYEYLP